MKRLELTASTLGWMVWGFASLWLIEGSEGWLVPIATCCAALALTVSTKARLRLGPTVAHASLLIVAIWLVWGLVVNRQGSGDVLVTLPSWTPATGGTFGGDVRFGQLEFAALEALRALGYLSTAVVLATMVRATQWATLMVCLTGRIAPIALPFAFAGEALDAAEAARSRRRAYGLETSISVASEALSGAASRAQLWWAGLQGATDRARLVTAVALLSAAGAVVTAVARDVEPLLLIGAAALITAVVSAAVGLLKPRPSPGGLSALISAGLLLGSALAGTPAMVTAAVILLSAVISILGRSLTDEL